MCHKVCLTGGKEHVSITQRLVGIRENDMHGLRSSATVEREPGQKGGKRDTPSNEWHQSRVAGGGLFTISCPDHFREGVTDTGVAVAGTDSSPPSLITVSPTAPWFRLNDMGLSAEGGVSSPDLTGREREDREVIGVGSRPTSWRSLSSNSYSGPSSSYSVASNSIPSGTPKEFRRESDDDSLKTKWRRPPTPWREGA